MEKLYILGFIIHIYVRDIPGESFGEEFNLNEFERFRNLFPNHSKWFRINPKNWLIRINALDYNEINQIKSDWFFTVFHQTRYKTFFCFVWNDSESFRSRFIILIFRIIFSKTDIVMSDFNIMIRLIKLFTLISAFSKVKY